MTKKAFRRFARDDEGGTLIFVGIAMFALVGFAGLAIDAGLWYSNQRAAQGAADSAAAAGAYEALWGGDAGEIQAAAEAQADKNGFPASAVTVNYPYTHTNGAATTQGVEVLV